MGKFIFFENFGYFYRLIKGERKFFFFLMIISLFIELLMIADNLLIKWVVDYGNGFLNGEYLSNEVLQIFTTILLVFLGVVLVRSFTRFYQIHLRNKLMSRVDLNTKNKYFNKVVSLDYDFHTSHKSGDLISKLDRGSSAAVSLAELITQRIFPPFLALIVVFFSIAYFDLVPALITTGAGIAIILFSWALFGRQAKAKLIHNENLDNEKGFVSNVLSNFESIKLFGKERTIGANIQGSLENQRILLSHSIIIIGSIMSLCLLRLVSLQFYFCIFP